MNARLSRRLIMFGVPLVLGLLELGHPALLPGDDIVATIAPIATWWTILHVLQVPLFALLGVAVFFWSVISTDMLRRSAAMRSASLSSSILPSTRQLELRAVFYAGQLQVRISKRGCITFFGGQLLGSWR